MRIGVVGYSSGKFDEKTAKHLVDLALSYMVHLSSGDEPISIVSGLTNLGIPKLAYEWAIERGITTVGVACKKAEEYPLFPVHSRYIIGENWGDESEFFLSEIDCLVRVGGGAQSLKEVERFRELKPNAKVFEQELERE